MYLDFYWDTKDNTYMKKNLITGLLAVIFFLSIFFLGFYYFGSRPVQAPDYEEIQLDQEYKNNYVSFRYPNGLYVEEGQIAVFVIQNKGNSIQERIFSISQYQYTNQKSVEDWWLLEGPQTHRQAPHPDIEKRIVAAGHDSMLTVYDSERVSFGLEGFGKIVVYVFANNHIFEITTHKIAEDVLHAFKNGEDIFEQYGITPDDIKVVEENQKLFWRIMNTLEFSEKKQNQLELQKTSDGITIATIELNPFWHKEIRYEYPVDNVPGKDIIMAFLQENIDSFWCINDDEQKTMEEVYENDLASSYMCYLGYEYDYKIHNNFFSHIITGYMFAGGAQGAPNIYIYVFDQQGKQYSLHDFLSAEYKQKSQKGILQEIFQHASYVDEYLGIDDLDFVDALDEIPFYLSEGNIHFSFSENHGLSHAVGFGEFVVPLEKIQHILRVE
jgi:hypothetical protein